MLRNIKPALMRSRSGATTTAATLEPSPSDLKRRNLAVGCLVAFGLGTSALLVYQSYFKSKKPKIDKAEEKKAELRAAITLPSASMSYGDLKAMGLARNTPVGWLQTVLEAVHVSTSLPWWGSIILTTVAVRLATVPIMVRMQRHIVKLNNIKPEMERISVHLKRAKTDNDHVMVAHHAQKLQRLLQDNKVNPLASIGLPMLQMPVMVSFYLALKAMSEHPVPQFLDGGFWAITDLSVPDPTYSLSVLSFLSFMGVLQTGAETGGAVSQGMSKNVMRGVALLMIPASAYFPASVTLYWLSSNTFSLLQSLVFKHPAVRSWLRIPLRKM